ncbi:hypothetical protein VitviT2T_029100 [Vitis vinifera]|uniref:N-acetyltransferase domain-containing protein n=1 Tax=Vitis vinifera TaxID=29760 RepID=A0ABY9DVB4_VITVI|nr:hypothetical protein VitviT2T_029100 [Vitis vinifera]
MPQPSLIPSWTELAVSIQFSPSPDCIVIESLRSIDLKDAPNVFMPYREAKHINEDIVKRRTSLMSRSSLLVRFNTSQSFLGALSSQLPNELIILPVTVTGHFQDGKVREKEEAATALYAIYSFPDNRRRAVGVALLFAAPAIGFAWWRRRKPQEQFFDVPAEEDPEVHLGQLKRFSLRELQVATDGSLVAVKRLKEERTPG